MNTEERLDCIDEKIGDLRVSVGHIEEQLKYIHESIMPMKKDIIEHCENKVKALGWKSISTIIIAFFSSIIALVINIFK